MLHTVRSKDIPHCRRLLENVDYFGDSPRNPSATANEGPQGVCSPCEQMERLDSTTAAERSAWRSQSKSFSSRAGNVIRDRFHRNRSSDSFIRNATARRRFESEICFHVRDSAPGLPRRAARRPSKVFSTLEFQDSQSFPL